MKWQTERWVKLYTRDTVSWRALPWEARGIFCLLLRIADIDGEIDLSGAGVDALATALGVPHSIMHAAVDSLISSGVIILEGTSIVIPNFVEAQHAVTCSAERQKRYRERKKGVTALRNGVTGDVTGDVTSRNGVTNRIEENREEEIKSYPYPPDREPPGQLPTAKQLGLNPRNIGTNPRALGVNPRAIGTNPRALAELVKANAQTEPPQESTNEQEHDLGPIQDTKTLPRPRERPRHVRLDQEPFLKQAYSDGIQSVTGKRFAVTGGDIKIMHDAIDAHAPTIGPGLQDWLLATVKTFAADVYQDDQWAKYKSGLSPKGFAAWLNEGRHERVPEKPKERPKPLPKEEPRLTLEEISEGLERALREADNG